MKIPSLVGIAVRIPRKFLVTALLIPALLVCLLTISKPAHAAGNDYSCGSTRMGTACVQVIWNNDHTAVVGYNASFANSGGCNYYDFNLWTSNGRTFGDEGAFWSCGGVNTYFFAVGDQGGGLVVVYQRLWPNGAAYSGWAG